MEANVKMIGNQRMVNLHTRLVGLPLPREHSPLWSQRGRARSEAARMNIAPSLVMGNKKRGQRLALTASMTRAMLFR
jgi:hypothetical protein